jgi:HSP20 family molecular chaperone IbpA
MNEKVRKRKNLKVTMCGRGCMDQCNGWLPCPQKLQKRTQKTSFKNGVFEVRLNKTKISPKSRIKIE